jgi:hypothetical protein
MFPQEGPCIKRYTTFRAYQLRVRQCLYSMCLALPLKIPPRRQDLHLMFIVNGGRTQENVIRLKEAVSLGIPL